MGKMERVHSASLTRTLTLALTQARYLLERARELIPEVYASVQCEDFLVSPPIDDCRNLIDWSCYQTRAHEVTPERTRAHTRARPPSQARSSHPSCSTGVVRALFQGCRPQELWPPGCHFRSACHLLG